MSKSGSESADAVRKDAAQTVSDLEPVLLVLMVIVFAVSVWSAPHDYAVLRSELSRASLADIFAHRATGQFGDSIGHVMTMANSLTWVLALTVGKKWRGILFAPLLFILAAGSCLQWSDRPLMWLGISWLALGAIYVWALLRRGRRRKANPTG